MYMYAYTVYIRKLELFLNTESLYTRYTCQKTLGEGFRIKIYNDIIYFYYIFQYLYYIIIIINIIFYNIYITFSWRMANSNSTQVEFNFLKYIFFQ